MSWPHEREFRARAALFWGLTVIALLSARSVPGISNRALLLGALVAAVISWIVYGYTRAIGSLEARFRHVHPRKLRMSNLLGPYLFAGLACALLVATPWLVDRSRVESAPELMPFYLSVPCMLAAAAGVHRILDRHRSPGSEPG